jgi:nucleotide-binding universal stress UspA family protein
VAIDQSDFRHQIINSLCRRKWATDTHFKILTVIEPLPFHWEQICYEDWKATAHEISKKRREHANTVLIQAGKELQDKFPLTHIHTELRHGRVADEIIYAASAWAPDKLILEAHGRSPNRLFPSAVSTTVTRHAECTIDVLRLHPLEARAALKTRAESLEQRERAADLR